MAVKLRTCACCGTARPTSWFSWNQKAYRYSPNCKDCGAWLFLFRKVFGPTRDWESNRDNAREYHRLHSEAKQERERLQRLADKPSTRAAMDLYAAFGIGMPNA